MEITEEDVEEEEEDDEEFGATTNSSIIPYISKVIYPGTLWCGAGNIANDLFSNLGDDHLNLPPPKIETLPKH